MAVYQSLSVTQVSQNLEENSSQVRILWESTQTGGSYNNTRRTAQYTLSVNGQPSQSYTVSYTLPMQTTTVILDITVTVPHDSRGNASVQVTTWMNTNISAGVIELSRETVLDTIAQAATLLASDGVIGGTTRLAITRKNVDHTHSIAFCFGALTGYVDEQGQVQSQEVRLYQDSVDFSIPMEFYSQIPNEKSGSCQLTLRTYLQDSMVGEPQYTAFTALAEETACLPTVMGQAVDISADTLALTGDATVFVDYASRFLCTVTAEAKLGAAIVKKTIAGAEAPGGSLELTQLPGNTVKFFAEDSRGFVSHHTVEVTKIPYQKPAFDAQINRTDTVGGSAKLYLNGEWFSGSFGLAENSLSACYSVDGVNFYPVDTLNLNGNRFAGSATLEQMAYDRVCTVTIRVQDSLFSQEKQIVLKKALPEFDWGERDFAFHVPIQLDEPLGVENGGTGVREWRSGVVIKDDGGLSAISPSAGAFYAENSQTAPEFGILPINLGGTGSTDALQSCINLGLVQLMEPGQEYATNHRWLGEPVYTKVVDYGALPNTKAKAMAHGAAATRIIACRGTASDGRTLPWGGIHAYRADVFCDCQDIYIDTERDYSNLTAQIQIWYTK